MQKKLTITMDQRVYDGLYAIVGRRRISQFIESLVKPYVVGKDLEIAYQQMARDESREAEALEWAEDTVGVSKGRLHNPVGRLSKSDLQAVEQAIKVQLQLT